MGYFGEGGAGNIYLTSAFLIGIAGEVYEHGEFQVNRPFYVDCTVSKGFVKKEGGGWIGIGRSPSLGAALPDPMTVSGHVVAVDRAGVAKSSGGIGFRIPRVKLKGAKAGDVVTIGIIGDTALVAWLADAHCG